MYTGHFYGYYFHPKAYPHSPGHPCLDIQISETPTGQHFDPISVQVPVKNAADEKNVSIEDLIIEHPWTQLGNYQVCAGRIALYDYKGRKIQIFTFGGQLHIHSQPTLTECTIESAIPILEFFEGNPTVVALVEETEIIFAERRACWPDDADFDTRLAQIPPQLLYAVCLQELSAKFNHMHYERLPHMAQFRSFIHAEIAALEEAGLWPVRVPPIAEVL